MKLTGFLMEQIAKHFGVTPESLKYWNAFNYLTEFKSHLPKVLITAGAEQFFRGFLNQVCISTHLDWLWPYWVNQQFYPKSQDFVARGLQLYTTNLTHRNWTAIGWPDGQTEPIVDPRGLLTPFLNSWSLDFLVYHNGELVAPARLEKVDQYLENNLPMVVTKFSHQALEVTSQAFVGKIPKINEEIIFEKVTLKNNSPEIQELAFIFSVRPYNPEGISLVNTLEYTAFGAFLVNKKAGVVFQESPVKVICSNLEKGDAVAKFKERSRKASSSCPAGLATGILVYQISLKPGEEEFFEARLPVTPFKEEIKKVTQIQKADFDQIKMETRKVWQEKFKNTLKISLPDKELQNAFEANLAFLRLFFDQDKILPGPFTYHHFWIRDAVYMTYALELAGFQEEALAVLKTLLKQQKSGAFLLQEGEWDSVGQVIWLAIQHFRLTNDSDYLKKIFPSLIKSGHWITNHRQVKISTDDLLFGLLPPGLSAEHFGYFDYYYWDNYWALAAIRELMLVSQQLSWPDDLPFLEKLNWEYSVDLDHSLEKAGHKIGWPILPISPHRGMDSAAIGSLASLYPLRIFTPFDQRVLNTLDYLEKNCFIEGGFFHDVNHSGFGTYLTMHIAECYLFERNPKFWSIFNWLLKNASPTFCWPEAIHPATKGGCMGDGHHGWAVAEFVILVRNLLFFEEYDRLIVTAGLKNAWLGGEHEINVANGRSNFGQINFIIKIQGKKLIYEFNNSFYREPSEIEINLPLEIEWATVDYQPHSFLGKQIFCPPQVKRVEVHLK